MAAFKKTYAEIAKMANVSTATVSRILTGSSTVKALTKQKVLDAMEQMGYNISEFKLNDPTAGSSLIIMNVPSIENPFYSEITKGAKLAASQHGYHLLLNEEEINSGTIGGLISLLKNVKAAGMITLNYISQELLKKLNAVVPIVQCCECDTSVGVPYVTIDDVLASSNVMEYILSTGRRKIAFINGPAHYKYAKHRLEGYFLSLKRSGIAIDNSLILQLPDVNYDIAVSATMKLLESSNRPEAIFAVSDVYAVGAIKAASRLGIKVPDDLIVVGFDNVSISSMTSPTITTVNQPKLMLGYSSCEILIECINSPQASCRNMLMDVELIIRESTTPDFSLKAYNNKIY